jgi:hypothetical protein
VAAAGCGAAAAPGASSCSGEGAVAKGSAPPAVGSSSSSLGDESFGMAAAAKFAARTDGSMGTLVSASSGKVQGTLVSRGREVAGKQQPRPKPAEAEARPAAGGRRPSSGRFKVEPGGSRGPTSPTSLDLQERLRAMSTNPAGSASASSVATLASDRGVGPPPSPVLQDGSHRTPLALLEPVCRAAAAATHLLEAPSDALVEATNDPTRAAMLVLHALEARRLHLTTENRQLAQHNRMLRDWMSPLDHDAPLPPREGKAEAKPEAKPERPERAAAPPPPAAPELQPVVTDVVTELQPVVAPPAALPAADASQPAQPGGGGAAPTPPLGTGPGPHIGLGAVQAGS